MTERNKLQSIGLLPFNIIMSIMLTYLMQGIAEISASTFALLWHMLSILIGFFLIFSSKHWILIFVVLPIWVMIHNPLVPRSFDQMNKMGSIVDSNSCGLLSEATLIETDEGVIKGKGSGQIGDYVMLRTTSNFGVSEVVFEVVQPNRYKSWLCDMARNLRQYMQRNLLRYRSIDRDWLRSFVLGEPLKIDSITQNALREFGLLHVVVLSGGHLSILSALVFSLLRFGFVLLYIARIVSARTWSYIWLLSLLLSIILIFAFCAGVGFSSSVQRAFLLFVLISTVDNFWGPIDRIDLYWKIWILQVVLFPIDIFNTSTYLSWCGSLILGSTLRPSKEPSFISEMFLNFKTQIWFCFLSAIVFSSINLWSILANVFLLPIFAIFLIVDLPILLFGFKNFFVDFCLDFQLLTLNFIRNSFALINEHALLNFKFRSHFILYPKMKFFLGTVFLLGFIFTFCIRRRQKCHKKFSATTS